MLRPVVARLTGGLGNQMFQYAAGRAAAHQLRTGLVLDLRWYETPSDFPYSLHHFNIETHLAKRRDLPALGKDRLSNRWRRMIGLCPVEVRDSKNGMDERFSHLPNYPYLNGFWQSERFFEPVADQIRTDFQITTEPTETNRRLLDQIKATNAVSVHVRRGDYLNPVYLNMIGLCPPTYPLAAVELIAGRLDAEPTIYVFSDDHTWVEENLRFPFATHFVKQNGPGKHYEDLRLMSACRHHVIANSSFSWWGAWLNPSREKIVVAPERWNIDPALFNPDMTPPSWLRI